jgi:hypothetical protein
MKSKKPGGQMKSKYKYRDLSRRGTEAALALLDEGSFMLSEDHTITTEAEGGYEDHRRAEPDCSYCKWIIAARTLIDGRPPVT